MPDDQAFNSSQINQMIYEYLSISPSPELLLALYQVSIRNLGFYTKTGARSFENPLVISKLLKFAFYNGHQDQYIIDFGTGVSPVPILLSDLGFRVTTVDCSNRIVANLEKSKWNDWGFLDYSFFRPEITSVNIDFSEFDNKGVKYDFVISISVIEHITNQLRRKCLKKCADILKIGGKLIFTVDIFPNKYDIWNRRLGKEVEQVSEHGDIEVFIQELNDVKIKLVNLEIHRKLPSYGVDIATIIGERIP